MALTPIDEAHALQIQAGTLGRRAGHSFEDQIAATINGIKYPFAVAKLGDTHVLRGDPAKLLLNYLGPRIGAKTIKRASAISTGAGDVGGGQKMALDQRSECFSMQERPGRNAVPE